MPWKPRAIGTPYDDRWRRIRKSVLDKEPLCRLCLSVGRTVPATVVDHMKPLQDGGTHHESNLMPLCKRCHDAVKTPADIKERAGNKVSACIIVVLSPRPEAHQVLTVNTLSMRRALLGWLRIEDAHRTALAAAEGIVAAWARGEITADIRIVMDCAHTGAILSARYGCGLQHQESTEAEQYAALATLPPNEWKWYEERIARWRANIADDGRKGDQPERSAT